MKVLDKKHTSNFLIGYFRLSVNGVSEKHSLRKDTSGGYSRTRFSKSPEQIEAPFSMTTIEEEQENISVALSLKNLNQIDEMSPLKSFNENTED